PGRWGPTLWPDPAPGERHLSRAGSFPSVRAGVGPPVNQDVLSDDVAGALAAKESARRTELLGRAKALGRNGVAAPFGYGLQRLAGFLGKATQRCLEPVGIESARQQVVDRHVGGRELVGPRQARDKSGQAAARPVRQAQHMKRRLDRTG